MLLWRGFLVAAYSSVVRRELEDKWSTIPWIWYVIALAVGFIGVVLVRRSKKHDDSDEARTETEYAVVRRSLGSVANLVERLSEKRDRTLAEVLHCIDHECVDPLSDFAESRQAMVKRFGLMVYADVMTEFASAERLINRSWSAAADGYVDEVASSLKQADQHLKRARELLTAADAQRTW
jgi:hypothetical protein